MKFRSGRVYEGDFFNGNVVGNGVVKYPNRKVEYNVSKTNDGGFKLSTEPGKIKHGKRMVSLCQTYGLCMQTDGNLVLYKKVLQNK